MSAIKVDPSQYKTVALLIGILLVALVVTLIRVSPRASVKPVVQSPPESGASTLRLRSGRLSMARGAATDAGAEACPALMPDHNPFMKPEWLVSASGRHNLGHPGQTGDSRYPERSGDFRHPERSRRTPGLSEERVDALPPTYDPVMPVEPRFDSAQRGSGPGLNLGPDAKTGQVDVPKVVFTLLGTVKTGDRFYGVIKSGSGDGRVVGVGDMLGNGFRVSEIRVDRAVLTRGSETVIVERPKLHNQVARKADGE